MNKSVIIVLITTIVFVQHIHCYHNFSLVPNECGININCSYVAKGEVEPQTKECCQRLVDLFDCTWFTGNFFLTEYLQTLQSWDCKEELKNECKHKQYDLTSFTSNVYLSFCDHRKLEEECFTKIHAVVNNSTQQLDWKSSVSLLNFSTLSTKQMLDSCFQIAEYEADFVFKFVEVIEVDFLTCPIIWSGIDSEVAEKKHVSLLKYFPNTCMFGMVFVTIIFIILLLVSLFFNTSILFIIHTSKSLSSSQFVYMFSIAVSNILTTTLVYPSVVYNLWHVGAQKFRVNKFDDDFSVLHQEYLDGFGVAMVTPILVSVYTLIAATAERLYAIMWPLRFHKSDSVRRARRLCFLVWFAAVAVSLMPIIARPLMKYDIKTLVLVTIDGPYSNAIYITFLGVPMCLMWAMTLVTYYRAVQGRGGDRKDKTTLQKRMTKTLIKVVTLFTFSVLPIATLLLVGIIKPSLNFNSRRKLRVRGITPLFCIEWFAFLCLMLNTLWCFVVLNNENRKFRKAKRRTYHKVALKIPCLGNYYAPPVSMTRSKSFIFTTSPV